MKEKLLAVLEDIRPDLDFETEKELIDDGLLDSLDIISILEELEKNFGVQIDAENLEPENFNSIDGMLELIQRLKS